MEKKKKLKLKKINIHPIFMFIILTFIVVFLSKILSLLQVQTTYSKINPVTFELETTIVTVKNMLNFDGLKFIIGNVASSFIGSTVTGSLSIKSILASSPLINLLIALIGLSVAHATGFIDAFTRRITLNIDNKKLTFFIILLATISSLVNDVGYVILIPLSALIFSANGRNPILGVVTAFCGVAFGYGTTIFVGSQEVSLISETTKAARLIDISYHISLTSNLLIMIISTIVISIVGTIIIEKIIAPKIGRKKDDFSTKELNLEKINESEQRKIELEYREKKGLKNAFIASFIFILCFVYMLIPSLPFSGLLLDMKQTTYLNQLFGENAYFQNGFTYMISLLFIIAGITYGLSAKTIENDKDLIKKSSIYLQDIGIVIAMIFFSSQFIAVFKETNIGTFMAALFTKMISQLSFSGVPLIFITMIFIGLSGLFLVSSSSKWAIFSPVVVPLMMQSNIAPQFSQFILRAADSMSKGITPLLPYFAVYIAYLNIYNTNKGAITMKKGVSYIMPYFLIITITWILLIIGWYLLGAQIGLGVSSTI